MTDPNTNHNPYPMEGKLTWVRSEYIVMLDESFKSYTVECCVAYSVGSSEPIKLSHNHFERHQAAFEDILVNSHQLKLESEPIGEGAVRVKPIPRCNFKQELALFRRVWRCLRSCDSK